MLVLSHVPFQNLASTPRPPFPHHLCSKTPHFMEEA